jgi:NAD dependent epimerase/dehydratase family enzyme
MTPAPAFALRLLFGDMSAVLLEGQRAVPAQAQQHGYRFRHADLDEALATELR